MEIEYPSDYVKVNKNIKNGDIVKLLDEGKYETKEIGGERKKLLKFDMELADGSGKIYTMNKTTQQNLIEAWGQDSKEWIGKELKAWVKQQMSFGKEIDVLILTPKDWEKSTMEGQGPIVGEEKEVQVEEGDQSYP